MGAWPSTAHGFVTRLYRAEDPMPVSLLTRLRAGPFRRPLDPARQQFPRAYWRAHNTFALLQWYWDRVGRSFFDTSRSTRQAVSALTATSTRHTGEWLTDRNILRVKDLRNQPPLAATRHAHTVSTCPQASYAGAIVQEPETYAGSETLSQHDCKGCRERI